MHFLGIHLLNSAWMISKIFLKLRTMLNKIEDSK